MNWILRLVWFAFREYAKIRVVRQLKRQGVAAYLRVLQMGRRVLIAAVLTFFFLQTVFLAGVGMVVTGLWLWDYDPHVKMQIVFGLSVLLFFLPMILLGVLLSDSVWYRASGAEKMVNDLLPDDKSDAA